MTEPPRRFAALAGTKGVGGNGGIEDSFYGLDGFYSLDSFYSLDGVAGPTGPSGPTELAGGGGGGVAIRRWCFKPRRDEGTKMI